MNKLSIFTVKLGLGAALFGVIAVPGLSFAHEREKHEAGDAALAHLIESEAVQIEDLGIETSGILQTNPFYFMKSWRRSTQRTFTFTLVKKIYLELDILNEKAAELKSLKDIKPDDGEAFVSALENYNGTLNRLASLAASLRDTTDDSAMDRLLDVIVGRSLRHNKLFGELKIGSDTRVRDRLGSSQRQLGGIVSDLAVRLDNPERFAGRLSRILNSYSQTTLREIWNLGGLERIQEQLPVESPAAALLLEIKEPLLLQLESKMLLGEVAPELFSSLEKLIGGAPHLILLIDDVRELVSGAELKSKLSAVRQDLLDLAIKNRQISKPEAGSALGRAKDLSAHLEKKVAEYDIRGNIFLSLISRVKFNAKQADESYAENQYGNAFGQASAAIAAAENALSQLVRLDEIKGGGQRVDVEVKNLKSIFDALLRNAKEGGLDPDAYPNLFTLFNSVEKDLVKTSDLLSGKINIDNLISAIRNARIKLAEANQSLNIINKHIEESAKVQRANKPLIERVLPTGR